MKEIHINYFEYNGKKIYLKERITLVPYRSKHDELWLVEYEPLGIDTCAFTKKLLKKYVYEDLVWNYEFFVLDDYKKVSPRAEELKNNILKHIKEK